MTNAATPQTDPNGQALMNVLSDLGAPPEDAYNATQGVRNMAGQNVTARLEAKLETFGAEIRAEIGDLSAKVDGLEAKIEGLAPASQVDALMSQVDALTSQVASQGAHLQTLTITVQDLSTQMQSLVAQVQAQAARADDASSMMTLLVALLTALVGTGLLTWFSDRRRERRGDGAGGSNNQPES